MPVSEAVLARTVSAYSTRTRATRDQVRSIVAASWDRLDQYRDADIDRFVQQILPTIEGGQRTVANLTSAYLAQVERAHLGVGTRAVPIPYELVTTEALRGVPAAEVYSRVGPTVWTALSNGLDIVQAAHAGLTRALAMASTDLQLAKTHTAQHVLAGNDRIVGYARVPGGSNVCDLCDIASTNRYHSGDLMPIHNSCYCDVVPIFGESDPGQNLDLGQLADDGRLGDHPTDSDVEVHEHGELGPVLTVRGQEFTGPDDLAA